MESVTGEHGRLDQEHDRIDKQPSHLISRQQPATRHLRSVRELGNFEVRLSLDSAGDTQVKKSEDDVGPSASKLCTAILIPYNASSMLLRRVAPQPRNISILPM